MEISNDQPGRVVEGRLAAWVYVHASRADCIEGHGDDPTDGDGAPSAVLS